MANLPQVQPSVGLRPIFSGEGFAEASEAQLSARLAGGLTELSEQLRLDRARAELSEASTRLRQEITDELEAIERDPNRIDGLAEGFQSRFTARANELMHGLTSGPEARFEFRDQAEGMLRQGRAFAFKTQLDRSNERATRQLNQELVEIGREAVLLRSPPALDKARLEIDGAVTRWAVAGHGSAEEAQDLVDAHNASLEVAFAKARLGAEEHALLQAEIETGFYSHLEADQLATLTSAAREGMAALNAETMETAILGNPFAWTREQILAPVGADPFQGGIERRHANQLLRTWMSLTESAKSDAANLQRGLALMDGSELYSNTRQDKRDLDLAFRTSLALHGIPEDFSHPGYAETVRRLSMQRGALPTSARARLIGTLNSPVASADAKLTAGLFLDRIVYDAPQTKAQFGQEADSVGIIEHAGRIARLRRDLGTRADAEQVVLEAEKLRLAEAEARKGGPDPNERMRLHLGQEEPTSWVARRTLEDPFFGTSVAAKVPLPMSATWIRPQGALERMREMAAAAFPASTIKSGIPFGLGNAESGGADFTDLFQRELLGTVTLEHAIQAVRREGGEPLPSWLLQAVAERTESYFRLGHEPDKALEHGWISALEEYGVTRYGDANQQLSWTRGPIEFAGEDTVSGSGFAYLEHDVLRDVLDTAALAMPQTDVRAKEPSWIQQYRGFLEAEGELPELRAVDAWRIGGLEGFQEFNRRLNLSMNREVQAAILATADFGDPDVQEALQGLVEHLRALQPLPETRSAEEHAEPSGPVKGRGFFARYQEANAPALRIARAPISDRVGQNLFYLMFQDRKGNWHTLPNPENLAEPGLFAYSVASSPYVKQRLETQQANRADVERRVGIRSRQERAERWGQIQPGPETAGQIRDKRRELDLRLPGLRELGAGAMLPGGWLETVRDDPHAALATVQLTREKP